MFHTMHRLGEPLEHEERLYLSMPLSDPQGTICSTQTRS